MSPPRPRRPLTSTKRSLLLASLLNTESFPPPLSIELLIINQSYLGGSQGPSKITPVPSSLEYNSPLKGTRSHPPMSPEKELPAWQIYGRCGMGSSSSPTLRKGVPTRPLVLNSPYLSFLALADGWTVTPYDLTAPIKQGRFPFLFLPGPKYLDTTGPLHVMVCLLESVYATCSFMSNHSVSFSPPSLPATLREAVFSLALLPLPLDRPPRSLFP